MHLIHCLMVVVMSHPKRTHVVLVWCRRWCRGAILARSHPYSQQTPWAPLLQSSMTSDIFSKVIAHGNLGIKSSEFNDLSAVVVLVGHWAVITMSNTCCPATHFHAYTLCDITSRDTSDRLAYCTCLFCKSQSLKVLPKFWNLEGETKKVSPCSHM